MKKKRTSFLSILIVFVMVLVAAAIVVTKLEPYQAPPAVTTSPTPSGVAGTAAPAGSTAAETDPPETTAAPAESRPTGPAEVVSTASVGTMGDLLMHQPIFDDHSKYNAAVQQPDGSYDFTTVFQYLTEYTTAVDYAAANLETTLCGADNGFSYSGYPNFNCPDDLIDDAAAAGFDMMLTANNHSYDTRLVGYLRTLEVVREKGLDTLGTYTSADETKWTIVEVNGIRIGMLCYTWASYISEDGRPSLNGNAPIEKAGLCNYFHSEHLPEFYAEVEQYLTEMEAAGAEATMMFIHWGQEYQLSANSEQKAMAQKLCDLGIDVIVGGHPHVIQPIELLSSSVDPDHKTVCLYSTGNAVSNQRQGNLSAIKTAHTEDGILFTVTFEKYSDGTVYLSGAEVLPTWVNMHKNAKGKTEYNILPLDDDKMDQWQELYDIGDSTFSSAKKSYDRTMDLVGDGLETVQTWLAQEKTERDAAYAAAGNS